VSWCFCGYLQRELIKKMNIQKCRDQIDKIDLRLLQLINERAKLALSIVKLKKQQLLPIFDPNREKKILYSVQKENPGPLRKEAVKQIFSTIIREHRQFEKENS